MPIPSPLHFSTPDVFFVLTVTEIWLPPPSDANSLPPPLLNARCLFVLTVTEIWLSTSLWKQDLSIHGDVELNPGPPYPKKRRTSSIQSSTSVSSITPPKKSQDLLINHLKVIFAVVDYHTAQNFKICHCFEHFNETVTELSYEAPQSIQRLHGIINRSFLKEILQDYEIAQDNISYFHIENLLSARFYDSCYINYDLPNDPTLQSLKKCFDEMYKPNETSPIKPLLNVDDYTSDKSFCRFIAPCPRCLLPGHQLHDCPFQFSMAKDFNFFYDVLNHNVLINKQAMIDMLLTMLHLQLAKNRHVQFYDKENNEFSLQNFHDNSEAILDIAKNSNTTPKVSITYQNLVFDIDNIIFARKDMCSGSDTESSDPDLQILLKNWDCFIATSQSLHSWTHRLISRYFYFYEALKMCKSQVRLKFFNEHYKSLNLFMFEIAFSAHQHFLLPSETDMFLLSNCLYALKSIVSLANDSDNYAKYVELFEAYTEWFKPKEEPMQPISPSCNASEISESPKIRSIRHECCSSLGNEFGPKSLCE
ncbi:hypothetical protein GEMRC1_001624 [Eukaryota sp. GEM-RC1]